MFACCQPYMKDHYKCLHQADDIFYQTQKNLMQVWDTNFSSQHIITKLLDVRCIFCFETFLGQAARDKHESEVCLPRQITRSRFFGAPLDHDDAFDDVLRLRNSRLIDKENLGKQLSKVFSMIIKDQNPVDSQGKKKDDAGSQKGKASCSGLQGQQR